MALLFQRNGYYTTVSELNQLNLFSSPKAYGKLTLTKDVLEFSSELMLLNIHTNAISDVSIEFEPTRKWYKWLSFGMLFSSLGLLIISCLSHSNSTSWGIVCVVVLAVIFYIAIYWPMYRRAWVKVLHSSGDSEIESFFSFDWRLQPIRWPWSRQSDIYTWFLNSRDCKELKEAIRKLIVK